MNNNAAIHEALKIAQQHAASGNVRLVEDVIKEVYNYLKSIQEEV